MENILKKAKSIPWISEIPGGFVTNSPKRKVFAFGSGNGIDCNGNFTQSHHTTTTFWTPKMSASDCTLQSSCNKIPSEFLSLILIARNLFLKTMTNVKITDFTFNIAVCNYYTEHDMYISPHTDDNTWYPPECNEGPVFASLTLYPNKRPTDSHEFAKFQIKIDNKWKQVNLPHNSLAIMPSSIEHRVLPHSNYHLGSFCPRINITFRSSYNPVIDPLMHRMAISNHARYYSWPIAIRVPSYKKESEEIWDIIRIFDNFLFKHNRKPLLVIYQDFEKKRLVREYKKCYSISQILPTMVPETFVAVFSRRFTWH